VGLLTEAGWSGEAQELPAAPVAALSQADGRVRAARLGRYELLLDQLGMEDQLGDMDLKVAGAPPAQPGTPASHARGTPGASSCMSSRDCGSASQYTPRAAAWFRHVQPT
jgi:hypothetical protein